MSTWWKKTTLLVALSAILCGAGCSDNMAQENAIQLQQQQQQLQTLQNQIDALKTQQQKFYNISSQLTGGCDEGVMHDASRRGEENLAAHDYERALAYYRDASSACPNSALAEYNLARVYQAMGERDHARAHYQRAIDLDTGPDAAYAKRARQALARLTDTR